MLFDILRFNQFALDLLMREDESQVEPRGAMSTKDDTQDRETIGEYLDREGYSQRFRDDYLIPMTAAVWSTSPDKCSLQFPAVTLVRFLWNHHLLSALSARPTWMTIPGGSKRYIEAVLKDFPPQNIHLRSAVKAVRNNSKGEVVVEASDGKKMFDHVILATHGDQALDIIRSQATKE